VRPEKSHTTNTKTANPHSIMITDYNTIPAYGADTPFDDANDASKKVLNAVKAPFNSSPAAQTFGSILSRMASAISGLFILVSHPNQRKAFAATDDAGIAAARAFTADSAAVLTPNKLANGTHEWTATGDALADLIGSEQATLFTAANITARKPTVSVMDIVDRINAAAAANGAPVTVVVDGAGVVKVFSDTEANLNTKVAAVVAASDGSKVKAEITGTAVPSSSTDVYLNV
jgi:hypothetical protein